jgi:hypothetical protein
MRRLLVCACMCVLSAGALDAQTATFKSYSSYEDYCADNPHAPTCVNGKPLKIDPSKMVLNPANTKPAIKVLKLKPQPATVPAASSSVQEVHRGKGPSVVTFPSQTPSPAAIAAVKTLGLHPDWRFADPHADMMMGINAAALRQSPMLRSLLVQLAPALKLSQDDVDSELAQTGDVDQFWISMHAGDTVLLLQGPRVIAPAGPTRVSNGMVAYGVSRGAVLVGHDASTAAAVQRLRSATGVSTAVLQMRTQGAESDVWIMGTRAVLDEAKLQLSNLSEGLSSYMLGVSLRDGLKATLKLNYATPAAARHALASIHDSPPPPEWPIHLSTEMIGTAVRMKVTVQQSEISKAVDKAIATPAAKPVLDMIAKSVRSSSQVVVYGPNGAKTIQATPAAPPPPGKLMIYGLPGGPKVM